MKKTTKTTKTRTEYEIAEEYDKRLLEMKNYIVAKIDQFLDQKWASLRAEVHGYYQALAEGAAEKFRAPRRTS
jgi:hypothetical protein